jgi:hypothetical protein
VFCMNLRTKSEFCPTQHLTFITETESVYCAVRPGFHPYGVNVVSIYVDNPKCGPVIFTCDIPLFFNDISKEMNGRLDSTQHFGLQAQWGTTIFNAEYDALRDLLINHKHDFHSTHLL